MTAIRAENLVRDFNGLRAVAGLTFSVDEGEIFGFLGPNGAGKTTTIRMLTGRLTPSSGRAWVAGCDVTSQIGDLKPQIGVVFEYQNLYERMSGRENLIFYARLYGVKPARVEELLELVGLHERAGLRVQNFSNGMRQRLLIARALLHRPRVLFLDEPTRGLDPRAALEIRSLVRELSEQGVTVFLTTHYMEEADQLCRRVAFIDQGKIVALDAPEQLKVAFGERSVTVKLINGDKKTFCLDEPAGRQQLSALIEAQQVFTLHSGEATLEEVYIRLTGRRLFE